jgi:hypothetical protein
MPESKNCHSSHTIKNGKVCGKNAKTAVLTSLRVTAGPTKNHCPQSTVGRVLLAWQVFVYMLGKRFRRNRSLIDRWIHEVGLPTEESAIDGEIKEIEFDEMWHFIDSKKQTLAHQSR